MKEKQSDLSKKITQKADCDIPKMFPKSHAKKMLANDTKSWTRQLPQVSLQPKKQPFPLVNKYKQSQMIVLISMSNFPGFKTEGQFGKDIFLRLADS